MSSKELFKIKVISKVKEKKLTQSIAAKQLGVTERQVRRLLNQFKLQGDKALISKKRGKPSNRRLGKDIKTKALTLVQRHYEDFGPKLANEYLQNEHQISISTETLRLWMIKSHLWIPRNKNKKQHPYRKRRSGFGELIQIDGSHHNWFENRAPSCVLMVFVDDATSAITSMHFSKSESLEAYYQTLEKHITNYGIPLSVYGDRCSVLQPRTKKNERTQFHKALKELNCDLILALSPEAKGKVERANRTLQDRLVKELRLKGISGIEEANLMLEGFRRRYNQLFSKKPNEQRDAHRPLEGICLERILCIRETRILDKNYTVQFQNSFYQISTQDEKLKLFKGAKVEIRELLSGRTVAMVSGKTVKMTLLNELESPAMNEKEVQIWKPRRKYIPPTSHPFKHAYRINNKEKMSLKVV